MRRIAPDSDRARDGTGLTACRARDGVGIAPDGVDCGILKLGWVGMVAYAFAAAAPDSDRARGWDGVAAHHRRGEGWDGVDCLPGEGWG